jgi:flagellar biosynthesis chaperone FliJ
MTKKLSPFLKTRASRNICTIQALALVASPRLGLRHQMQQQTSYTHLARKKKRKFKQLKENKDMKEEDPNYLIKLRCIVDYG